jgi:HlyD family secretion protein
MNVSSNEATAVRQPAPARKPGPAWTLPAQLGGRRGLWLAAGAAFVLSLALGRSAMRSDAAIDAIPSAPVKRGDVRITVTESGELRAENQATVQAPTDKQIVWMIPEGTFVEEGEVLVRMEATKYEIQKDAANAGLAGAEAELQSAISKLEGQKNAERKAYLDYQNLPSLAEKGFINHSEVESARLAYEEVRSATQSFEAAVNAARAKVEFAKKDVDEKMTKVERGIIKAPRAGLVVYASVGNTTSNRKIEVGMTPFEGMDLMYLPDISTMSVDTEISEVDLARVSVGSPVEVRLDAYPDSVFRGEVTHISGLARQKISKVTGQPTGLKVFDVAIRVLDTDKRLKPGLTATVDILVSDHKDVAYIPIAGIFIDDLDRTVVYVKTPRGVEERPVQIGESSERVAVVSEGLAEGEEILLGMPEQI